jgi:hypothetical protein
LSASRSFFALSGARGNNKTQTRTIVSPPRLRLLLVAHVVVAVRRVRFGRDVHGLPAGVHALGVPLRARVRRHFVCMFGEWQDSGGGEKKGKKRLGRPQRKTPSLLIPYRRARHLPFSFHRFTPPIPPLSGAAPKKVGGQSTHILLRTVCVRLPGIHPQLSCSLYSLPNNCNSAFRNVP